MMKAKELAEILLQNPDLDVMYDGSEHISDLCVCLVKIVQSAHSRRGVTTELRYKISYANDEATMDYLRDVGDDDCNSQEHSSVKDAYDTRKIILERVLAAPLSFLIRWK